MSERKSLKIKNYKRSGTMQHNVYHCLDWTKECPKSCYRAQVTEEAYKMMKNPRQAYPFTHLLNSEECPIHHFESDII